MINEMIKKLNLPSPLEITGNRISTVEEWEKARPVVLKTMLENEYGYMPEDPENVNFEIKEFDERRYCAGKAYFAKVEITSTINGESFTFPVTYVYPKKGEKHKIGRHASDNVLVNRLAVALYCYNGTGIKDAADFLDRNFKQKHDSHDLQTATRRSGTTADKHQQN